MLNWKKKESVLDIYETMGERLDNTRFQILCGYENYTLLTRVGSETDYIQNEIGSFKTFERARMVAELIDEG